MGKGSGFGIETGQRDALLGRGHNFLEVEKKSGRGEDGGDAAAPHRRWEEGSGPDPVRSHAGREGWRLGFAPGLKPCGRIGPSLGSGVSCRPPAPPRQHLQTAAVAQPEGNGGWRRGLFSFFFFYFFSPLSLFQAEFMFV